eukprot:TRINITY_DN2092_c0_g1_i2.p1 TRINITY_DN2092_c0_g1~~TRINITY_DN2092_c0_g1_i2.p1  ORF type:complete len:168 (-),score=7.75 TRINITY_DN2092_c0_g1_i2:149-652(-)
MCSNVRHVVMYLSCTTILQSTTSSFFLFFFFKPKAGIVFYRWVGVQGCALPFFFFFFFFLQDQKEEPNNTRPNAQLYFLLFLHAYLHKFKMSGKTYGPDLKKYLDKSLAIKLNGNRKVCGVLRGYDQFMNLVLDNTVEEVSSSEKNEIGMVVIRGNSVVMMEALEAI